MTSKDGGFFAAACWLSVDDWVLCSSAKGGLLQR